MRPRKIIAYVATIARRDGSVEWLDRPWPPDNYGMAAFLRSIDTILWGRRTWEQARAMGAEGGGFDPKIKNSVFSHRAPGARSKGAEFVDEPVDEFAARVRRQSGKDLWVMGGAEVIGSFLDAGELDELIVHVVPVLIGEGIPLLPPKKRTVPLRLGSARKFSDGVVRLRYAVRGIKRA